MKTTHEEGKANARLIASAPELLEALEDLIDGRDNNLSWAAIESRVKKARSAIAKAKGE